MAIIHLVFSKPREGLSEDAMEAAVAGLNALDSLDCVEYLHIGRATGHHLYTHALYAHFGSREALDQYFAHPRHVAIAQENNPATLDDFVAVDWEWPPPHHQPRFEPCSPLFLRLAILKPRQGLGEMECAEVIQVLSAYEDRSLFPSIAWVSYGEGLNIYPELDKGFRWGFVCAFSTLNDLHEFNSKKRHIALQDDRIVPKMEEIVAMDCCIPPRSDSRDL